MFRPFAVLLTAFAILASTAPGAAAWEPANGAVFNNPYGNYAARWKIVRHVDEAVRQSPRGSKILISTFLMDSKPSADALVTARNKRDVAVQIVSDADDADTGQMRRMARVFNADNVKSRPELDDAGEPLTDEAWQEMRWGPDRSFVVSCQGSCRGPSTHNNHAKFYLFSQTGTASHVTMVSSSNLNAGGAVRGWNDLYVVKRNPAVYDDYATLHAEMAEDTAAGDRYREFVRGPFTSRFYPKPSGGDPVLADLSKVACKGANGGAGRNGRTLVNVSMFAWNSSRGMAIAKRLVRLDNLGCDVSVIYGAPSKTVRNVLRDSARRGGIKLWDSRIHTDDDGLFDVRTHQKYVLINGRYGGDRSSWRVHTGSQNWGRGTLRGGDENTLNIATRAAYRQYIANWHYVATHGSRRIGR